MRAWMLPAGSDGFDKLYLEERPDPAPGPTAATTPAPSDSGIDGCLSAPPKYLPAATAKSR